jgi:hypothetical protein
MQTIKNGLLGIISGPYATLSHALYCEIVSADLKSG